MMATRTLSHRTQRWVVQPHDHGDGETTYSMLEAADAMGDGEKARLAYWRENGYPTAVLATVTMTTTLVTDDDPARQIRRLSNAIGGQVPDAWTGDVLVRLEDALAVFGQRLDLNPIGETDDA